MNADGSGVRQVSTDNAYYDLVNWAPDGQSLLVHSFGNGKQGVYSMDTQTGETQQLFAQQNAAPAGGHPMALPLPTSVQISTAAEFTLSSPQDKTSSSSRRSMNGHFLVAR